MVIGDMKVSYFIVIVICLIIQVLRVAFIRNFTRKQNFVRGVCLTQQEHHSQLDPGVINGINWYRNLDIQHNARYQNLNNY